MMLTEILGIYLIALLAYSQDFFATSFIGRPLVTGGLLGVLFHDIQSGLFMGAMLEIIWLGLMGIGATVPPDYVFGGILGISLALLNHQGIGVAMILAFTLAPIGSFLKSFFQKIYIAKLVREIDINIENGMMNSVSWVHLKSSLLPIAILALAVTIVFHVLSLLLPSFITLLPHEILIGLDIASGILPVIGLAGLFNMIVNKQLMGFPFIGFVVSLFVITDMLNFIGVSIILAVGYLLFNRMKSFEEVTDEEF